MKNLDLEKVIIIVSLVLLPAAGGWIYYLNDQLQTADKALNEATPILEEIHGLQELITLTKKELDKPGESVDDAGAYFENRAIASQSEGAGIIRREQIRVNQPRLPTQVRSGGRGPIRGEDIEVKIEFGRGVRGGLPLPRSYINAFVFNCESRMPVWKLRSLSMTNKDFKSLRGATATPPLETSDEWLVSDITFARRRPVSPTNK